MIMNDLDYLQLPAEQKKKKWSASKKKSLASSETAPQNSKKCSWEAEWMTLNLISRKCVKKKKKIEETK